MVNLNNLMYKLWVYVKNDGMYVFLAYLVDLISYAQGKDWSQQCSDSAPCTVDHSAVGEQTYIYSSW